MSQPDYAVAENRAYFYRLDARRVRPAACGAFERLRGLKNKKLWNDMDGLMAVTNNQVRQPDRPVDAQVSAGLLLSNPTEIQFTQHMTKEDAVALAERAARELGEHFDAVQILATWTEEGGSILVKRGAGNWYARTGMAHEFIASDIAQDAAVQIAQHLQAGDDDEDGD